MNFVANNDIFCFAITGSRYNQKKSRAFEEDD